MPGGRTDLNAASARPSSDDPTLDQLLAEPIKKTGHSRPSAQHTVKLVREGNQVIKNPVVAHFWNPVTAVGHAALNAVVTRQVQIIAYLADYNVLMLVTLAVVLLLSAFKKTSDGGGRNRTGGVAL
jgi:hypothetical protein